MASAKVLVLSSKNAAKPVKMTRQVNLVTKVPKAVIKQIAIKKVYVEK